jgi:hypothetical protein
MEAVATTSIVLRWPTLLVHGRDEKFRWTIAPMEVLMSAGTKQAKLVLFQRFTPHPALHVVACRKFENMVLEMMCQRIVLTMLVFFFFLP